MPSLAEAIAGGPIRDSWWAHPKGTEIYRVANAISNSDDVLVCKLIEGKVTYVHQPGARRITVSRSLTSMG